MSRPAGQLYVGADFGQVAGGTMRTAGSLIVRRSHLGLLFGGGCGIVGPCITSTQVGLV